ncbi:hypothetical protein GCM10007939_19210 [Amylibacter marinus]|uniref:DUF2490 domain-containing protein n=1 Tax=Amylibacter marinus TaxID=1475483 RepID=A0ABQ5VX19_9RHOB|nr:hypothetical protein [Amylibacter marinus]GLQ35638.1 hypothetical protein GCM10007939_19210 [Amylibacter marinus]
MRRFFIITALFGVCLFWAGAAVAEKPKVTAMMWGGLKYPNSLSPTDEGNIGSDATFRLEVDFGWRWGRGRLVPFLTTFTQSDSAGYAYNAKQKIGLGLALKYKIKQRHNLSFSVKYETDYRYRTFEFTEGASAAIGYDFYRRWQGEQRRATTLAIWSNARYPGSVASNDRDNLIVQGQAKLTRSMSLGNSAFSAGVFTRVGLFWDSKKQAINNKKQPFNNKAQFDLGLELKRKVAKFDVSLYAMHRTDHRSVLNEHYNGVVVGMSFFRRFEDFGQKRAKEKRRAWWRRKKG